MAFFVFRLASGNWLRGACSALRIPQKQNPIFHLSLETGFLGLLTPFQILLPFRDEEKKTIGKCRCLRLTPNLLMSQEKSIRIFKPRITRMARIGWWC